MMDAITLDRGCTGLRNLSFLYLREPSLRDFGEPIAKKNVIFKVCESGVECANIDPFVWERAGQWRGGKVRNFNRFDNFHRAVVVRLLFPSF